MKTLIISEEIKTQFRGGNFSEFIDVPIPKIIKLFDQKYIIVDIEIDMFNTTFMTSLSMEYANLQLLNGYISVFFDEFFSKDDHSLFFFKQFYSFYELSDYKFPIKSPQKFTCNWYLMTDID